MPTRLKTPVTTLLGAGADAMDNLYDVEILFPFGISKFSDALTRLSRLGTRGVDLAVRADGFTPPKQKIDTYEVTYGANKLKRPKPSVVIDRSFIISFRLDAYYDIYRIMQTWRSMVVNASTGFATGTAWSKKYDAIDDVTNEVVGSVMIRATGTPISMSDQNPYRGYGVTHTNTHGAHATDIATDGLASQQDQIWEFKDVWVSEVGEPVFKTGSGSTMSLPVTFVFGDFIDPVQRDWGPAMDGGIVR